MHKSLTFTLAALFAMTALAGAVPTKDEMMEKEKAAWQAFKDKDAAGFKKVVDKDFRSVSSDGISNMAREMESMKKWDMKSFAISDFDMFSDEKDVVVTTYVVKVDGTVDGKDESGTYNAGSVWKIENGKWMAIFHSSMKQEGSNSTDSAQKKE